ncbi:MAG: HD domain-containing protein [Spirochaetales bacterium]
MNTSKSFNNLISSLENKKYIDTGIIKRAFEFARELHKGQKRKTGEEYIEHPVAVAQILADLNFDENVISAALLHDVVEDCGCTIEEIKQKFNIKVANLVDSVTAIKAENKERNPEFYKFLMEEKTYNKLYSIGMNEKLSFYVKFADRLHNLSTIGVFPKYKQIEKVKETEKYLIPILNSIKANTLYYAIKNECYKIVETDNYNYFYERYESFLNKNRKYLDGLLKNFELTINNVVIKQGLGRTRVLMKSYTPYEIITEQLTSLKIEPTKSKEFMLNNLIVNKIFIILKNNNKKVKKEDFLYKLFASSSWFSNFKLMGFFKDEKMVEMPMIIEDGFSNKYAIFLQTEKEHFQYDNGVVEGIEIPYDEELKEFEISENYIKVKTNIGEEVLMPERSTVLDFAFKIHNDFGFSCLGAYLNNSPNKVPVYTVLNNGDQVNLVINRDEGSSECIYIAKIKWLSYVNTEYSKKKLSKYFESLYENY